MKNLIFFVLIVLASIFSYIKSTPISIEKKLEVVLLKNREPIVHINQTKNIDHTKTFYIDRLYFYNGNILNHYKLGKIGGYVSDFYLIIKSKMEVKESGEYTFLIQSDDGFILKIDNQKICNYDTHRPITLNECKVNLQKGEHALEIEYYQGFGNQGLIGEYKDNKGKIYYIGQDSKSIEFKLP